MVNGYTVYTMYKYAIYSHTFRYTDYRYQGNRI